VPKLHEVLAINNQVLGQAKTAMADLTKTFTTKKHSHFSRKIVTFRPNTEGREPVVEQQQELQTTVRRELTWLGRMLAKAMDTGFSVDEANSTARASVVLDNGKVFLTDVPATGLLRMHNHLNNLFTFVATIPTLDPAQGFVLDPQESVEGDPIYRAQEVIKPRMDKVFSPVVMYAATDKHPAQVKELMLDKPIGTVQTLEWSGLITTAAKGDMLARVEELQRAVKQALARANDMTVPTGVGGVGEQVLAYVFGK